MPNIFCVVHFPFPKILKKITASRSDTRKECIFGSLIELSFERVQLLLMDTKYLYSKRYTGYVSVMNRFSRQS